MNSKPVTLIISDLHVGGGPADKGDDFIYSNKQFPNFVRSQAETPQGERGDLELIINGDFLEFAQVLPDAYTLNSADYWCSEGESLEKLDVIMSGHPEIFQALKEFQTSGNRVTLTAGNHDVELYWDAVQREIRAAAGAGLAFELGEVWSHRYDGLLRIGHGHHIDPANRFQDWKNPIRFYARGNERRLEMCPGTLFVTKFVNWLERKYPFADNLHPVTKLGSLLWRESKWSLGAVAWMLSCFAARHAGAALSAESGAKTGERLRGAIATSDNFARAMADLWRQAGEPGADVDRLRQKITSDDALLDFLLMTMSKLGPELWTQVLDRMPGGVLGGGGDPNTLAVGKAGAMSKEEWRKEAVEQWLDGGEVVVMGHTHEPDEVHDGDLAYYNPGCWTRYVEGSQLKELTLESLKKEEDFPYKLHYVRVQPKPAGGLDSEMVCFESGR